MRSFLRNIRSKPKSVRNQYALGISLTFTGLVAAAWLFTGMNLDEATVANVETNDTSPFGNLTNQIKEQWATARESLTEEATSTASTTVVEDPLSLTITPETKAELASTSAEWNASGTEAIPAEFVVIQIATSSSATSATSSKATTTSAN